MSVVARPRDLTDVDLEREHVRLLYERDDAHNRLQHLNRRLDEIRAERIARAGALADGESQC